jgi:hypothetical protein
LLNILHILLACSSSSLMPMIHKFCPLMESQSSYISGIFNSQDFSYQITEEELRSPLQIS